MKGIGVHQLHQKTYKNYELPGEWGRFMGRLMAGVIITVYGRPGNGKTELLMRMAKAFGMANVRVAWISYEQGHGMDLQMASARNNMKEVEGKIVYIDPWAKRDKNKTLIQELQEYIGRRNSPDVYFIDSWDDSRFTYEEFEDGLMLRFPKKSFVVIARAIGKLPTKKSAQDVEFKGQVGIYVRNYIAYNHKNRMGGRGEYIIWEEEARKREPLYFAKMEGVPATAEKGKRKRKAKTA